jgi:cytochrome c
MRLSLYFAVCGTLCVGPMARIALPGRTTHAASQASQAKQKKSPPPTVKTQAVNPGQFKAGKAAYATYCGICHLSDSTEKKIGPGLKGLGKREKFADGNKIDDASLRAWIEKGGKTMPSFKDTLRVEEIRNLMVYLKTL